jgi:hypothetical protein
MRGEVSVNTGVAGGCEERGGCRKYRRKGERDNGGLEQDDTPQPANAGGTTSN